MSDSSDKEVYFTPTELTETVNNAQMSTAHSSISHFLAEVGRRYYLLSGDVETQNNLQYVFFPVSSGAVRFKVKAMNDAHVALTKGNYESDPMTELHIGGWGNTKSVVRRNRTKPDKVEVLTPGIMKRYEYVGLWIRWHSGCIAAGMEGCEVPFISYDDPSPHPIDHVAICTGWGASGSWKIEVSPALFRPLTPKTLAGKLRWEEMTSDDPVPPDAVIGGFEDGEIVYVIRATHNTTRASRAIVPGKYKPSTKCAFVSWGTQTHKKEMFQILCGSNFIWVTTTGDSIPPHAFPGGIAAEERGYEDLFIGRALLDNNLIPGRVHLQYKTCYIACGEFERELRTYEILVIPEDMPKQLIWHQPKNVSHSSDDNGLPPEARHRPLRCGYVRRRRNLFRNE